MNSHKEHLAKELQLLQDNNLFAKTSKCAFGLPQVEYLGHVISGKGVATDPSKVESMLNWKN